MVKKLLFKAGDLREVGSRKIPWRREWQPTPVFLPGESRGQRSLVGCGPWDHTEPGKTERLSTHTRDPNLKCSM